MKIFVSGQINEAENVRAVFKLLEENGHTITHDWTATDTFIDSKEKKLANIEESGRRAAADISGVVNSDIYILMSDNENVGKGMYVELGGALVLREKTGAPKIYVVGPMNHMTIFYLHPYVKRFDSIQEVIDDIQ